MNIYLFTYILWILSELILNRIARSGKLDKKSADKNTELYIWIAILLSITAGVFITIYFPFPIFENSDFKVVGLAIILIGIAVRFIAIRQLGTYFTVDVTIRADHQLMQSGLYKYIRHPSYTGAALSLFGMGLSLDNLYSFPVVFIPTVYSLIHRIKVEEKVLVEQFGKQYTDYMLTTKRLIPFVY